MGIHPGGDGSANPTEGCDGWGWTGVGMRAPVLETLPRPSCQHSHQGSGVGWEGKGWERVKWDEKERERMGWATIPAHRSHPCRSPRAAARGRSWSSFRRTLVKPHPESSPSWVVFHRDELRVPRWESGAGEWSPWNAALGMGVKGQGEPGAPAALGCAGMGA